MTREPKLLQKPLADDERLDQFLQLVARLIAKWHLTHYSGESQPVSESADNESKIQSPRRKRK